MSEDEREIRALVARWMEATRAGDMETVLGLMTDDVVFLLPGREPMDRAEFARVSARGEGARPEIEGKSEVQEVVVAGDWASMWTKLEVRVRAPGAEEVMVRAGYTLSVLRKVEGRWLLARDANLLTRVE
jgi:uncharacterized protein (TIGR02246 family)